MAEKKYLDYNGLQDVAGHVNTRLKTVTSIPVSADNGAVRLYVGTTTDTYIRGHIYQYNSTDSEWVDITNSYTAGNGINIENNEISADTVIFTGTQEEWDALTTAQKQQYDICNITDDMDDFEGGTTVVANPTGVATDELEKIQIGSDIYSVGSTIQVSTIPTASADYVGKVYQYIGTTTQDYTHNYFYECVNNSGTYSWVQKNVQPTTDANAYHTDDSTEATLANDDAFPFLQAGETPVKKKTLWSNIKAKLKSYFDDYYNYSYTPSVIFANEGTASSNSVRKQIINITDNHGTQEEYIIDGTTYLEQTVTLGTTDTTVTFSGSTINMDLVTIYYFNSDTVVSVYAGRATGDVSGAQNQFPYKSIYVDGTNHTCSIVFPALSSAVSVKVRVYIR